MDEIMYIGNLITMNENRMSELRSQENGGAVKNLY